MSADLLERLRRDLLHSPEQRAEAQLSYQGLRNLAATQRLEVEEERQRLAREAEQQQQQLEQQAAQQAAQLSEQAKAEEQQLAEQRCAAVGGHAVKGRPKGRAGAAFT